MTFLETQLFVKNHPEYFDPKFRVWNTDHNKFENLKAEQVLQGAAIFILLTGHKPFHSSQIIRALANVLNV